MSQFLVICRQDLLSCAVMGWTGDGQPKRAWPTFLALLGEIESVLLSLQDCSFISSGNKHIWELSLGAHVEHSLKGTPYGIRIMQVHWDEPSITRNRYPWTLMYYSFQRRIMVSSGLQYTDINTSPAKQ